MTNPETAVREAATALHQAITAAEAAGLKVSWPYNAAGLPAIAISDTGHSLAAASPPPKPTRRKAPKSAPDAD